MPSLGETVTVCDDGWYARRADTQSAGYYSGKQQLYIFATPRKK